MDGPDPVTEGDDAQAPAATDPTVIEPTVIDPTIPGSPDSAPGPGRTGELATGTEFAGYVIEGLAGQGGMGVVYRARQLRPSRTVALKVISPQLAGDRDFRERFARESEIAASIEHSNVIPVDDVGEESNLLYIAMRYIEGTDLRAVIAADGRLAAPRAAQILAELTSALDAAHARGLVDRDVSPATSDRARGTREHAYLTDFGLAESAAGGGGHDPGCSWACSTTPPWSSSKGVRSTLVLMSTPPGCVLYQMLTGSVPFPHEHEAAIMLAHISAEPRPVREPVPSLPAELDAVIARAMAKNPDERYPSAGDLGSAALAAAEGQRAPSIERSVATGPAAPGGGGVDTPAGPPPTRPTPPPAPPPTVSAPRARGRPSGRIAALSGGAILVIVIGVLAASGAFSSSSDRAKTPPHPPASTPKVSPPTTKTYSNSALGVSFAYPSPGGPSGSRAHPPTSGSRPALRRRAVPWSSSAAPGRPGAARKPSSRSCERGPRWPPAPPSTMS